LFEGDNFSKKIKYLSKSEKKKKNKKTKNKKKNPTEKT